MEYLQFHTEEMPQMAEEGARFVVVAVCGSWRDGEVTNYAANIPGLQRELRKRFMNRLGGLAGAKAVAGKTGRGLPA